MEYYMNAKQEWANGIDCRNPAIWQTAEEKAKGLVCSLGYTDLFQPKFRQFYFDIVARRNGKVAVFQVTTLRIRQIKRQHIELANYFGWDYFIIQVKPTLDVCYIQRVITDPLPETKVVNYHQKNGGRFLLR